ncbi:MAG: T9SS type A sorting domain-containing protein [Candidatus Eisenbacteria bacterium]|nr:T9SS type A sorting domain-containing protein [Candidatus Eisenbacteria bacterium]
MMLARATAFLTVMMLCCMVSTAGAAVTSYGQSFEGLIQTDPDALGDDGWLVYGNVFDPDTSYLYGYGPFAAPNHNAAFCQIVTGEGGPSQEAQQLVVFSDYENTDHAGGNLVESNVYREYTIEAGDVGTCWFFEFDAKLGNITGSSTAAAFIKTLDPGSGYALTNFITVDMTSIPVEWQRYGLRIGIDASLAGQLLQFGFMNLATLYEPSGIFYDNIEIRGETVDVPEGATVARSRMSQNCPNPFNPTTRIDFAITRAGAVEIAVFDISGRRVATLHDGELGAGEHSVTWDGTTDRGESASSGLYLYVLETPTDRLTRRMMLVK